MSSREDASVTSLSSSVSLTTGATPRRRGDNSEEHDTPPGFCRDCVSQMCMAMLSWCGFGNMKRWQRVMALWSWLLFLGVCLALGVVYFGYGTQTTEASPADMYLVNSGVSTVFCRGLVIQGDDSFKAYLLDQPPSIDPYERYYYTTTRNIDFVADYETVSADFYLLQGSKVNISTCLYDDGCVTLYVFKGQSNFDQWQNDACFDCYVAIYTMTSRGCVDIGYQVARSDRFFFVYQDCQSTAVSGMATIHLDRTVYDVSNAVYACSLGDHCQFDLKLDSDESVVWQAGVSGQFLDNGHTAIHTSCQYRLYVVLFFFLCVPVVLGIVASILIYLCCSEPPEHGGPPRSPLPWGHPATLPHPPPYPDERSPLVRTPVIPRSRVASPPKYEDVCRVHTPPPTYDQAVHTSG